MTTNIRPFFSHYIGFDEEAHAFFALNFEHFGTSKMPFLLIGTNCGRCLLFSSISLKQIAVLHEDTERRQIVAIGRWPFEEEIKNASSSSGGAIVIWLHFRCHSVALFELSFADFGQQIVANSVPRFRPMRELSTGHYGFCHALADPVAGRMFIPDHEELSSSLRICYRSGGEKVLVLGQQFMHKSWAKSVGNAEKDGMFNGLLMGMELLSEDNVLLAFEDSTVCVFNLATKTVVDALKHPKRPEFLCLSVFRLPDSDGICGAATANSATTTALVAVSVIGQVYLLSVCATAADGRFGVADDNGTTTTTALEKHGEDEQRHQQQQLPNTLMLRAECKVKMCKRGSECTALAFCSGGAGQQQQQRHSVRRLASGFKDGLIEIRSVFFAPPGGAGDRWATVLLAKCDFHAAAGAAIRVLSSSSSSSDCAVDDDEAVPSSSVPWPHGENAEECQNDDEIRRCRRFVPCAQLSSSSPSAHLSLLFAGASDGKVSLFVLPHQ